MARPKAISPITPVKPSRATKMRYGMRKAAPAQLGHTVGEQPDIGHAHRTAHAGEDEPGVGGPGVARAAALAALAAGRACTARLLADLDGPAPLPQ